MSISFFMHRVYILGREYKIIVGVAALFLLLELAVCLVTAADYVHFDRWDLIVKRLWLISIHNGASAVADLLITAVLIRKLRQSRTGFPRRDSLISVLIKYSVSTGLITGIYNIVSLLFTVAAANFIYLGIVFVGIKLYSNSVLAALNSRQSISRRHLRGVVDMSLFGPFGISVTKASIDSPRPN
ncbi:hypothetical protein C8Q74DRAFT_559600 [Fomes fomentarius]|nr:hypothetical protein C8Q74DRAFT_559600 [Fomes fomentarius]